MRLNVWGLLSILVLSCLTGCKSSTPLPDRTEALRVSDNLMADLIADHMDVAADKFGAKLISKVGGKAKAEEKLREALSYCGRPLESELSYEATGILTLLDGGSPAKVRVFAYSGRTTLKPKGDCLFVVQVIAGTNGPRVVRLDPQMRLTN